METLSILTEAVRVGRRSIAAVMGGRGMGKTSLALEFERRLREGSLGEVHFVRYPSADPLAFVRQLERALEASLDASLFVETLAEAIRERSSPRVVLMIDEIESLLNSVNGPALLDNMRIVWEQEPRFAIIIFGGSRLHSLLQSDTSPFLRTARWLPLFGLSLTETSSLVREPLGLDIDDSMIEAVWAHTGGHPLMIQRIMEETIELARADDSVEGLPFLDVIERLREEEFEPKLFPILKNNLGDSGGATFERLSREVGPVQRSDWIGVLGDHAIHSVEVLRTSALAGVDDGLVTPTGEMFRSWWARSRGADAAELGAAALEPASPSASDFERFVIDATSRWVVTLIEHPNFAIRSGRTGNDALRPEAYFQISLLHALRQHPLLQSEAEALSGGSGRADVKVRWSRAPLRNRSTIEVKIFGRKNYREVIQQAIDYSVSGDAFACVVMVDHHERPLRAAYRTACIGEERVEWEAPEGRGVQPVFRTAHALSAGRQLRVYHFLVQL